MKTMLIADDDRQLRTIYELLFAEQGFDIRTTADGAKTLNALQVQLPDVMLLDITLPDICGSEILKALRQMPGGNQVKVIVISGKVIPEDDIICRLSNVCVRKPIGAEELFAVLKQVLGEKVSV